MFVLSTTSNKIQTNQKEYSTSINKINILGLEDSMNLQLLNKFNNINIKNIFNINREEIKGILSQYNIIEEYNVKKIYPSSLNINIKQTNFVAKVSGISHHLVGANGKVIMNATTQKKLPYILIF